MRILEGRLIVGVIGNCILPRIKLHDAAANERTAVRAALNVMILAFPERTDNYLYKHVTYSRIRKRVRARTRMNLHFKLSYPTVLIRRSSREKARSSG